MNLRHSGMTDVGRKRDHNEDNFLVQSEDRLFVVCDGMGGHASGEVASQIACDKISEFFSLTRDDDDVTWPYKGDRRLTETENRIAVGVKWANLSVFEKATTSIKFKGMGTTCVSALFSNGECAVAHVGDSRGYRIRDGAIEQVTEDHSLLNDYKKLAQLTPDEIKNFPHKNIITRALGMKPSVVVDTRIDEVRDGDIYLLCCDGLSGELESDEMLRIVLEADGDLDKATATLIEKANEHGGRDNITVVLVQAES
ncbi:MAG: Stp1/IreP family PP2C-type Ser/Thr phosphatase [Deltaproteobacteria bacterium]|nr:Stp1/IreP family PP2C-type Ser/Thr phosphatase [Deltaproteobacteria bacterium]